MVESEGERLPNRCPDPAHVVVIIQRLKKLADFRPLFGSQFRVTLGQITGFAGDNRPTVLLKPFGDGMNRGAIGNEPGSGRAFGDIVVLLGRQDLDFIGAGFDGGLFAIRVRLRMIRLDQPDMFEEKLVAAAGAELAFLEQESDFGSGPVDVVRHYLDQQRDFVRGVALIHNMFHDQLVIPRAGSLFDRSFDHIPRHALLPRPLNGGKQPRIALRLRPADFGGDHDFADNFAGSPPFLERGNGPFGMQPLATHARILAEQGVNRKAQSRGTWFGTIKTSRYASKILTKTNSA